MSIIKVTSVIYFVILFVPSQEKCSDEQTCVQTKTHGMVSADCYNQNFRTVPQCLRTDVEIIDLSYNRIRKVSNEDLRRYKKLKLLYLFDNLIITLDDMTFDGLDNLITLDLSLNAIIKPPASIFRLPELKRLYLSQNLDLNIVGAMDEARPIISPLELLDISFNELKSLPDLGILPHLLLYNISGNHLLDMKIRDIAGVCNLKTLANTNFSAYFQNPCDCWSLQQWLQERKVQFTKIACDLKEESCPYSIPEEDLNIFNHCKSRIAEIKRKSSLFMGGIIAGAVGLILLILVVGYIVYRRRKNRRAKLQKEKNINAILNAKMESAGLL